MAFSSEQPDNFTTALLTPQQMGLADRLANNVAQLMQAAGWNVARAIMQRFKPLKILVLTGPGNNGEDGKIAGHYLSRAGWPVEVKDFKAASLADVNRAGLVVDAIFGAGLSRMIDAHTESLLRHARQIVAIDVPSGVDGATGRVLGYALQAVLTVTFVRKKPGHLLFPGRALCGELLLRDIGMDDSIIARINPDTWENGTALFQLPLRTATDHKYSHGDVTILSGALPGAARLAAMAARRAGAGMVSIAAKDLFSLPEAGLILRRDPVTTLLQDPRRKHWLIGPGLGVPAARELLPILLNTPTLQIVADADALTACVGTPDLLRGVQVITPHEGEFTRLFGPVEPDKLTAARRAAAQIKAVVVLKGPDTVIAAPDGRASINTTAPPWLATAGTGDVLAGMITALLAQGMAPFSAACAGVWLHGKAAQQAGPGMLAEDLPALLRPSGP